MPTSERFTFENAHGQQLAARLDLPDGEIRAYALFAHCFTCSKDLHVVRRVAKALSTCGIAMMGVDFTGLGQSEGDFSHTTFSTTVDDLVTAANELARTREAPQILIGHSLGGAAVLAAAEQIPSAKAIATINAPCTPDHVRHLFTEAEEAIEARGEALVDLGGRPFCIRRQFLQDLDSQESMAERIRQLDRALLVFHSPVDQTVGIEQARLIYDAARHPKSFVSLDGADHLLTNPADALYVGNVLAAWAERFLDPVDDEPTSESDYADPTVTARTGPVGFRTDLAARGFELVADEPTSIGGTETAPTPYDYLGMALAACTSMTLQMYARRKGLQLDDVHVSVTHARVHATDCAHCETTDGHIDRLTQTVTLTGELTETERARLLEIANRCPVHRTLENEIDVVTVASSSRRPTESTAGRR
ncbi:MAG: bifunctional alpha/beta hydrolase/OsmC family protein [Rubricoccaceae bacterium]